MTRKSTSSPVDAWGTPEHEAAMDRLIGSNLCPDVAAGRECSHVWSDRQLADYQRHVRDTEARLRRKEMSRGY